MVALKMGAENMLSMLKTGNGMKDMRAERSTAREGSRRDYQLMLWPLLTIIDVRDTVPGMF